MTSRSKGAIQFLFIVSSLCVLCLIFLFSPDAKPAQALGSGAISLANFGVTVSENFDSLSSTTGVTTATNLPTGWYLAENGTGTSARKNDAYAVSTGSDNSGDIYSFGISLTNPITDRAFGTLYSIPIAPKIGAKFTNDTGGLITSVIFTYTGEMWRAGVGGRQAADTLAFQYSTDAISLTSGTWISYTNLDFSSPVISTTVGNKDGNSAQFRTVISSTISGLSISTGSTFWIRWIDLDIAGADDGLAVDDFSLTPIGSEQAPAVASTSPGNGAINVPLPSNIVITFTEPVTVTGTWLNIVGSSSGTHTATVSGGPTIFTLDPITDFSLGETVTVTVYATQVNDWDANPPPNMLSDYIWTFTTIPAPAVSSTSPISNAINVAITANIVVTFNEPVNVSGTWYMIGCGSSGSHTASPSGGATTWTLNPSPNFANNESCTVTILASQVTDQVSNPPVNMASDYSWTFTTAPTPYRIHDIQGVSHISPISGTVVSVSDAIVTAKFPTSGFFMQERDVNADANDNTSEGIFVRTSSAPTVSIGDSVNVFGMVTEYRSGSANLSRTEIDTTQGNGLVQVNSSRNALPLPIIIGAGGRVPPTTIIENDVTPSPNIEINNTFDPNEDGIDFFESLESMLVQVNNAVAVGPTKNTEVVVLADSGGNGAGVRTARGGIIVRSTDFNPERLILASSVIVGSVPNVNVGATFVPTQPITAVVDYNFDNYKLQVTAKPIVATNPITPETTTPASAGQLAIATFNVQNLSPTDSQSKFNSLASLVVNNLKSPDLIVVEEVQDNNGTTDNGVVDATTTITKLITAITSATGPTYDYRQIDPVDDQDGGAPGGNIRVVFLFRTDRGLSFVDRPCGGCNPSTTATYAEVVSGSAQFHHSPGRVDPTNTAWSTPDPSRKPLAGEFFFNGNHLFVIGNHWKSKGGDDPLFGRYQPPTQYTQVQRNAQAVVVKNFIDSILALDPNARIIAAGDFNDFEFSSPLTTLKASVMHALVEDLPANERHSYNFEGNSETLDHILISNSLYNNASPQFDIVHVNSEFAAQVSDHDPSVVRLTLVGNTTTTLVSTPNPVMLGQSVTFTSTVSIIVSNRPQRITRPRSGCGIAGTVDFKEGSTILGSGTLDTSCVATFTTSTLPSGLHSIVAVYSGDGYNNPSTSNSIAELVTSTRILLPLILR